VDGAFQAGPWLVEPQLNHITDGTRTIHLEPKVMRVLVYLADHAHEVVPKERLIQAVWPDTFVTDDVLTHAISELRRAFGDDPRQPRFILTVPKSGYRLVAPPVRASQPAAADRDGQPGRTPAEDPAPSARAASSSGPRRRAIAVAALVAAAGSYWLARPVRELRLGRSVRLTDSGDIAHAELHREVFPALATDGARVYFTSKSAAVNFVSLAGGEVGTLALPKEVCHPCLIDDLSVDGSALLVRKLLDTQGESPLWLVPTAGGAARRVGGVIAHAATWLAGGRQIAFANGNDLFTASTDGSDRRKVLVLPKRAFWLRASPDGRRLRFTLRDPSTNSLSLWEANTDGSGLRELLPGWNDSPSECCGTWTPDGRYFLFQSARGGMASLWALPEGRHSLRGIAKPAQLTTGPFGFHSAIASRDGNKVFAVGQQVRTEPLRYDVRSRAFEPFLPGIARDALRFSRDGKWITDTSHDGMWRMKADGSDRLQLTSPPMLVLGPFLNWSPDATQIAFPAKRPGGPWKIYLISRDGGSPEQLVSDDQNEADPDWSPDGSSVMFGRMPDYMAEPSVPKAIHIVDLKTRAVSKVPGSDGLFSPHWSPDGRYIAAQPLKQGKLFLFDFATGKWRVLADRWAHNPMWSRDGRYVYAQDSSGIWRVRVSDGDIEQLTGAGDLKRRVLGLQLTSLAPDDSPIGVAYHGNTDIYAFDWEVR
jgi:DNA-binding winged helix-turn-helix (wHTH) protein/Tol biopolymer transport system component